MEQLSVTGKIAHIKMRNGFTIKAEIKTVNHSTGEIIYIDDKEEHIINLADVSSIGFL